MNTTPDAAAVTRRDDDLAVLRIDTTNPRVTAIERFSLDGSEPPAPSAGAPEDYSTVMLDLSLPLNRTVDRPETVAAAHHLDAVLRHTPGFVAGLLLAGHHGELVLYSQWDTEGAVPVELPPAWSLGPALEGVTRVDGRTYLVDSLAPGPISEASRTTTPNAHFGVFTVAPENQEALLALNRTRGPGSLGTAGLRSINFHRSLDGRRVINLGLWDGYDGIENDLLHRPGFTSGQEYWAELAGWRGHHFDVASLVTGRRSPVAARTPERS